MVAVAVAVAENTSGLTPTARPWKATSNSGPPRDSGWVQAKSNVTRSLARVVVVVQEASRAVGMTPVAVTTPAAYVREKAPDNTPSWPALGAIESLTVASWPGPAIAVLAGT